MRDAARPEPSFAFILLLPSAALSAQPVSHTRTLDTASVNSVLIPVSEIMRCCWLDRGRRPRVHAEVNSGRWNGSSSELSPPLSASPGHWSGG